MDPLWVSWPGVRIRRTLTTERGVPVAFLYQLEFNEKATLDGQPPDEWIEVARFDHDVTGPHNVLEEGLHCDLYIQGEKDRKSWNHPNVPIKQAPSYCEQYLIKNADFLLRRAGYRGLKK